MELTIARDEARIVYTKGQEYGFITTRPSLNTYADPESRKVKKQRKWEDRKNSGQNPNLFPPNNSNPHSNPEPCMSYGILGHTRENCQKEYIPKHRNRNQ